MNPGCPQFSEITAVVSDIIIGTPFIILESFNFIAENFGVAAETSMISLLKLL